MKFSMLHIFLNEDGRPRGAVELQDSVGYVRIELGSSYCQDLINTVLPALEKRLAENIKDPLA